MTSLVADTFSLTLPQGWTKRDDEGRVYGLSTEPPGVLCCTASPVENSEELPNLSRMLAGFLTRSGHPVATDELLRVSKVAHAHGFCWQYSEEGNFTRLWMFGNRESWLLMTFTAPEQHVAHFHPLLDQIVESLTLHREGDR